MFMSRLPQESVLPGVEGGQKWRICPCPPGFDSVINKVTRKGMPGNAAHSHSSQMCSLLALWPDGKEPSALRSNYQS